MSDTSRPIKTKPGNISAQRLKSFIERIEKLEEERKAIGGDIRDVYSEAKGGGFDVKTMRKLIALRKMDAADRDEQEAILDVYRQALGMDSGSSGAGATVEIVDGDALDKRAVQAIELLGKGNSTRAVAATTGLSKSNVARILQAMKANQTAPQHHGAADSEDADQDSASSASTPGGRGDVTH